MARRLAMRSRPGRGCEGGDAEGESLCWMVRRHAAAGAARVRGDVGQGTAEHAAPPSSWAGALGLLGLGIVKGSEAATVFLCHGTEPGGG
jgi:hypothetical protein